MRLIDADALIAEYPDDVLTHCDIKAAATIDMEMLQPQWIPVEERLPDVYRDEKGVLIPFLVSGAGGKYPRIAVYNNGIWSAGLFRVDVTAWMPLPSVYKSKDKEE